MATSCSRYYYIRSGDGTTTIEQYHNIQLHPITCMQVAFGGDQLTAERARNVQLIRVNSEDSKSALAGLLPYTSDWHAEVILLQVVLHCQLLSEVQ